VGRMYAIPAKGFDDGALRVVVGCDSRPVGLKTDLSACLDGAVKNFASAEERPSSNSQAQVFFRPTRCIELQRACVLLYDQAAGGLPTTIRRAVNLLEAPTQPSTRDYELFYMFWWMRSSFGLPSFGPSAVDICHLTKRCLFI